uniref:Uncharacterized protein n=1 Tax=Nelumbo nucifera TaxID=4432 RepID=A0A822XFK7_NELNU|nr:TPA_asm: hypothetical protein HUJ06_019344 [Nelumbo nucifera]
MKAVFLGGSGTRRECCGTGVFLPRRIGSPAESRKKPACSTVLLPARVVQALNLNFDDMGARRSGHQPMELSQQFGDLHLNQQTDHLTDTCLTWQKV